MNETLYHITYKSQLPEVEAFYCVKVTLASDKNKIVCFIIVCMKCPAQCLRYLQSLQKTLKTGHFCNYFSLCISYDNN